MARQNHVFEDRSKAWTAVIIALIGALGTVVAAVVSSSPSAQSSADARITVVAVQGQRSAADGESPSTAADATAPGTTDALAPPSYTSPPPESSGHWIAQLASVPYSDGSTARDQRLQAVQATIPQAQWLSSDQYGSLTSGFWVVYVDGPFANGAAAFAFCRDHGRQTETDCLGRYLSADPADHGLQCAWTGTQAPPSVCYAKPNE